MNKNNQIIVFVLAGIILLGIIGYFLSNSEQPKYSWSPEFRHDEMQPYDFSLMQKLVQNAYQFKRSNSKRVSEYLADDYANINRTAYLYIGHGPYHDKNDARTLKKFAEKGGKVLIFCNEFPDSLLYEMVIAPEYEDYEEEEEYPSIYRKRLDHRDHPTIKTHFINRFTDSKPYFFSFKKGVKDTSSYYWAYINNHHTYRFHFEELGFFNLLEEETPSDEHFKEDYYYDQYLEEEPDSYVLREREYLNFVKMDIGEGSIYWHTNPILFSNLYLSPNTFDKAGFAYLDRILAHIEMDKVIWDHASTRPNYDNNELERQRREYEKPPTPMEYIFSQPPLTWAWLILVIIAILYAIFGTKRRQRAIPIVEANRNTSLEFVSTIGRLYFQQQNHKVIFEKMMQLFLSHIRQRYTIVVREMDEVTIKRIIMRSDIAPEIVFKIFERYQFLAKRLENKSVEMSADTLNNFYLLLERFYEAETIRKTSVTS